MYLRLIGESELPTDMNVSDCLCLLCDGVVPVHSSFRAESGGMCSSPSDPELNKSVEEMDGSEVVFGGVMPSS